MTASTCICGETRARKTVRFALTGARTVVRCAGCGQCRTDPPPYDEHGAGDVYGEREETLKFVSAEGRDEEHRSYVRLLHEELAKVRHGKRLLDFGCGPGYMLKYWLDHGYDARGCELNPHLADFAEQRAPGRILRGTLDEIRAAGHVFDVIFANHVLEHIPDPAAMLRTWGSLLAPDGVVLIAVPNIDSLNTYVLGPIWPGLQLNTHLWHFAPRTLGSVLTRAGFTPERVVVRTTLGTDYHTHRATTLPRRIFAKVVMPVGERVGRGDQVIAVARVGAHN